MINEWVEFCAYTGTVSYTIMYNNLRKLKIA